MFNDLFEKTVRIYESAGLGVENSDIRYLFEKTNPKDLCSVAAMTYLSFDNMDLDSVSKIFDISCLLVLFEALTIDDTNLEVLTNESRRAVFCRKMKNEHNFYFIKSV